MPKEATFELICFPREGNLPSILFLGEYFIETKFQRYNNMTVESEPSQNLRIEAWVQWEKYLRKKLIEESFNTQGLDLGVDEQPWT